ncbi:EnpEP protein [Paenibacillus darwinianus]|uniref:EnpEP protein n=1 Tax=Paenibacillus darwinianus TaxID=1380763 RepID=A0A9W5S0A0_9BACL|nr:M1 family metallopeptidase [Paenibacillus darwinianus]EXX84831.1 EnpEP protein [Paenibacillus darwinianus]EXX86284.1 EnpEP protein [Paenibacillus darwinianus]EXX86896.1 EnpEP protein [Paenibacillus darwinianus]
MNPRAFLRMALLLAAAALLIATLRQGFGSDAWLSKYTIAPAPNNPSKPGARPSQTPAQPPRQEMETVQKPKPVVLSKRVTEYHIGVQLLEQEKKLAGEQTVTWRNPGKQPVPELFFNLYPNAFESKKTTFMRESGGKLREDRATEASVGSMRILSVTTEDGGSLLPRLQYVSPDDGNADDRTLARLRLPDAVPPGGSVTLRMTFEVALPAVFARMGYAGEFVMAGQWFPKLAVYEPAGTRGRNTEGWNVHQYHGNSEFYSDFSIYNVRIQVPERYKVAATGFPAKPSATAEGSTIYQYYADDVIDFAWAASPDFIEYEEPFSAPGVPGVRIKLYLDPLHANLKERYMHAAKSALAKYAQWYGEYPYSTLSIVVPPKGGNGAGGMEYPTLVTAFAAEDDNPGFSLERTVVHEIGHQYWYGMVASNEFEEAWLDEGFTSYAEDKVMETVYGLVPNLPVESSYMTDPAPLKQLSWSYRGSDQYAENVYMRAKLVLLGIERQVGDQTMRKVLRTYFQKYKFKHPSTADFQQVVEQVTRTDWDRYFRAFVYGSQMSDIKVESIRVTPIRKEDGQRVYESVVKVRRNGGSLGAVAVVLQFADGTMMPRIWDGKGTEIQFKITHVQPLAWAVVDPKRTNVLDNKGINNFMKAELPATQRNRWSIGVVKTIELLFSRIGW